MAVHAVITMKREQEFGRQNCTIQINNILFGSSPNRSMISGGTRKYARHYGGSEIGKLGLRQPCGEFDGFESKTDRGTVAGADYDPCRNTLKHGRHSGRDSPSPENIKLIDFFNELSVRRGGGGGVPRHGRDFGRKMRLCVHHATAHQEPHNACLPGARRGEDNLIERQNN